MSTLAQLVSRIPFYDAYDERARANRQEGMQNDMRTLQMAQGAGSLMSLVQQQEARRQAAQREAAMRAAIAGLPANATHEQVISTVRPFAGADDLLKTSMSAADREAQRAATKEATLARLANQAQQIDLNYKALISRETRADARANLEAQYKQAKLALDKAALRMTGERLNYETGASIAIPDVGITMPSQPAQQAPQAPQAQGAGVDYRFQTPSGIVSGTAPTEEQAATVGMGSIGGKWTGPAQATTQAAPQAAPVRNPTMPPHIAAAPRKVQDAWTKTQASGEMFGNQQVQRNVTKALEDNYTRLRDAPQQLANIEKAKALIPAAKLFQGSLGEQKLSVSRFFNNNLGTSINLDGVKSAEELRSRIFFNVMDNLKKMDAQPSQLQQQIMQDALGNLGTNPSALGNILDAFGDAIRDKVSLYEKQVSEAETTGIRWPHKIEIPKKQIGRSGDQQGNAPNTSIEERLKRYR